MTTAPGTIRLDGSNTRVAFAIRWFGAIVVRGRFRELEGMLEVPGNCLDRARLEIDVHTDSVHTGIALRDRHLRGPRFLDAARYPSITFQSACVQHRADVLLVSGMLTLRGRPSRLSVQCTARDIAGNGTAPAIRFSTRFGIARAPFRVGGIEGIQRLNPLMVAIGSDVLVDVELNVAASRLARALHPGHGP